MPLLGTDDPPGAYLFLPKGPAKPLKTKNIFVAIDGIVMQKVPCFSLFTRVNLFHLLAFIHLFLQLKIFLCIRNLSSF